MTGMEQLAQAIRDLVERPPVLDDDTIRRITHAVRDSERGQT